jgi:chitinase
MLNPRGVKQLTNEMECPNIVELAVHDGLKVELSRRIVQFHDSQSILPRYGRTVRRIAANIARLPELLGRKD